MPDPLVAAIAEATDVVGDRWSLPLVVALRDGPRRYSQLADDVPGVATNVLATRLGQLERAGIVVSRPYQLRPLRQAYELTERGVELAAAAGALAEWAVPGAVSHAACGSPLETSWWCSRCEVAVADPDEGVVRA